MQRKRDTTQHSPTHSDTSQEDFTPVLKLWDQTTFRVTRIPEELDASQAGRHISSLLGIRDPSNLKIHSLASEALDSIDPRWKTATVSFRTIPESLRELRNSTLFKSFDLSLQKGNEVSEMSSP